MLLKVLKNIHTRKWIIGHSFINCTNWTHPCNCTQINDTEYEPHSRNFFFSSVIILYQILPLCYISAFLFSANIVFSLFQILYKRYPRTYSIFCWVLFSRFHLCHSCLSSEAVGFPAVLLLILWITVIY